MQTILMNQNPHWEGRPYSNLTKRLSLEALIQKIDLPEIQILLGIRRSGKSSIFKLLINALMEKHSASSILYLNLDDPFFIEIYQDPKLLYQVVEAAERVTSEKVKYLFLDEIQQIEGWEHFVKSVYDSALFKKIFVTGSNSNLLETQYTKLLSGRFFHQYVYPFSFKELLHKEGITSRLDLIKNRVKVLNLIDSILHYGSFPRVEMESEAIKRDILVNYYNTILLKDCIADNVIRETKVFKQLAHYLITNIASLYSYRGLSQAVDLSEKTVKQFIAFLEEGYLLEEVSAHSFSVKKQLKSQKKSYCMDNGLIYANSFTFSENLGKLFENLVYSELKKSGIEELYIFREQYECDFIIKQEGIFTPIQVCYELNDRNRDRELRGLKAAMKVLNGKGRSSDVTSGSAISRVNRGYLITYDQEESLDGNIEVVPFWKYFSSY